MSQSHFRQRGIVMRPVAAACCRQSCVTSSSSRRGPHVNTADLNTRRKHTGRTASPGPCCLAPLPRTCTTLPAPRLSLRHASTCRLRRTCVVDSLSHTQRSILGFRPLSAALTLTLTLSHTSCATPVSTRRLHVPPARRICAVDSLIHTQRGFLPASAPVLSLRRLSLRRLHAAPHTEPHAPATP